MSTLFIDRANLTLELKSDCFVLRLAQERLQSIPSRLVERVILRADTMISSGTLALMAERGIGVVAIGGRTGSRAAFMTGSNGNNARIRISQCINSENEVFATHWCRPLVLAKLRNQIKFIQQLKESRPDLRRSMTKSIDTMRAVEEKIVVASSRANLRGLEGAGAAAYFKAYKTAFAAGLKFEARQRRPPPDPVNACLSLGYTLLTAEAVRACWIAGLDPAVGFLHVPAHSRPSMACDLIEPWRVRVDRWVLLQFRERHLRPEHFGSDGTGSCILGKTGRATYYHNWAEPRKRLEKGLRRHARLIVHGLLEADAENVSHAVLTEEFL